MFRGSTIMVPLLLLLLLHESLADQVCFTIQRSVINVNVSHGNITDKPNGPVACNNPNLACIFQCQLISEATFIKSNFCVEARMTEQSDFSFEYRMEPNLNCTLYKCKDEAILPLIKSLDSGSSNQRELTQLFSVRDACAQLFSISRNVRMSFIKAEEQIIHNIMETTQVEAGSNISYSLEALSLNVFNISEAQLSSENNSRILLPAPQVPSENMSFVPKIWLPVDALETIPKEERIIGLVSYIVDGHFQPEQGNISSMVIRVEELGEHLQNLNTSVKMVFRIFPNTSVDNVSALECHYFDVTQEGWKQDGCKTSNETRDDQIDIICDCDHATPFAVLLIRESITEVHWKILSYISYIGCGLSAFFTALSLVIYVFSRNHKLDYSISIHVSLSGALFLLNTTFLLTEWGATVTQEWVCVFVAAVMHYSLLCCFTWMAIEALHLYLLLIKVFNTYYKHYLIKLSLVGWGIPGVIVAVSLGVKDFKQFYGVTQMTMANSDQISSICWITDDSFFYSLNLVYFTLIFIFNSGILITVASSICKMKRTLASKPRLGAEAAGKTGKDAERFSVSCRSGLTVLGLTCLMGTTWGLAFLGSGYVNYPILYLFCILNSLQGFFIFLWICLSARKQRRRQTEDRMTSMPVKTSGIKSE